MEEQVSREPTTLEDMIKNLPRWLRGMNSKMRDDGLVGHDHEHPSRDELNQVHERWLDKLMSRLQLGEDDPAYVEVRQILTQPRYMNTIAQTGETYSTQINFLRLAEVPLVKLEVLCQNYHELQEMNTPSVGLDGQRTVMRNAANRVIEFMDYCIERFDDIRTIDTKVLDTLIHHRIPLRKRLSPSPEGLILASLILDKAGLTDYLRNRHPDYTMDSDSEVLFDGKLSELDDEALAAVMERRAGMLDKSPIYMKPAKGAQGNLVMCLTYDKAAGQLYVESGDRWLHQLIRLSNDQQWKAAVKSKVETCLSIANIDREVPPLHKDSDLRERSIEETLVLKPMGAGIVVEDREYLQLFNAEVSDYFTEMMDSIEAESCIPLDGYEHTYDGDEKTTISGVPRDSLAEVLAALQGAYYGGAIDSYAEERIESLLLNGRTWEIRVVNQSLDLKTPKVTGMYCKVGKSKVSSNISQGGSGRLVMPTVMEIYSQIYPDIDEGSLWDLAKEYVHRVMEASLLVTGAVSEYFTSVKNTYQRQTQEPDYKGPEFTFPFETVNASDISTDFMARVVDTPAGKRLRPVLVDVNFSYGISAMPDERTKKNIYKNRITIKDEVVKVLQADADARRASSAQTTQ